MSLLFGASIAAIGANDSALAVAAVDINSAHIPLPGPGDGLTAGPSYNWLWALEYYLTQRGWFTITSNRVRLYFRHQSLKARNQPPTRHRWLLKTMTVGTFVSYQARSVPHESSPLGMSSPVC